MNVILFSCQCNVLERSGLSRCSPKCGTWCPRLAAERQSNPGDDLFHPTAVSGTNRLVSGLGTRSTKRAAVKVRFRRDYNRQAAYLKRELNIQGRNASSNGGKREPDFSKRTATECCPGWKAAWHLSREDRARVYLCHIFSSLLALFVTHLGEKLAARDAGLLAAPPGPRNRHPFRQAQIE
jgi:hypothetical protein